MITLQWSARLKCDSGHTEIRHQYYEDGWAVATQDGSELWVGSCHFYANDQIELLEQVRAAGWTVEAGWKAICPACAVARDGDDIEAATPATGADDGQELTG